MASKFSNGNQMALRFAAEYLADPKRNATQAAIRAGYSSKTATAMACKLLKRPDVKAAIAESLDRIAEKLDLQAEKVLQNIHRMSMKAEFAGDFNAGLRGQELIGKHLKLFTEKHEHGGIGGGPIQMVLTKEDENL